VHAHKPVLWRATLFDVAEELENETVQGLKEKGKPKSPRVGPSHSEQLGCDKLF
jgi:hypothetical protein